MDFDEEAASKACANSGSPDHMNRFEFMKFGKVCWAIHNIVFFGDANTNSLVKSVGH